MKRLPKESDTPRNSNMNVVRYLLLFSIVVGAASAETIFEEIEEELFDDVLRPILDIFPRSPPHPDYAGQDVGGGPLFLSAVADPVEARRRARVPPFLGVKSYAGYITVNEAFRSNLFFWFFKAFVSKVSKHLTNANGDLRRQSPLDSETSNSHKMGEKGFLPKVDETQGFLYLGHSNWTIFRLLS